MKRTRRSLARVILLTAGAVVAGLLTQAVPANADPTGPVTTYLAADGVHADQLFVNTMDGSGTATLLSPDAYIDSYDVSDSGDVVVAEISTRGFAVDGWDTSWGIVRVSRTAGTTHLIGTDFDGPIALTPDGSLACWISDAKVFCNQDGTATGPMPNTLFAPRSGETVYAFALSPDGTMAAALYVTATTRVLRVGQLNGTTGYSATWQIASPPYPLRSDFTWISSTQFLYSIGTTAAITGTRVYTVLGGTADSALGVVRSLSQQNGTWYMWRADDTALSYGSTADIGTPPATWTPRTDAAAIYGYDVTGADPPAMTTADNRPTTTARLVLRPSTVLYRHRAAYCALADYFVSEGVDVDYSYANLRGTLSYSVNAGRTWTRLTTTTGAKVDEVYGDCSSLMGTTQVLTRTTWFRWAYPGDMITKAATSRIVVVGVSPVVTVKVARSGSRRIVRGTATRVRGTAMLQRYSKHRWVKVATTAIGRTGAYSFGARSLPRGSYRVITLKDASWAQGLKAFRI